MAENGVPNVNFKGFIGDNVQANWIEIRKIYGEGDPSLPMVGCKHTCLFHCRRAWIR